MRFLTVLMCLIVLASAAPVSAQTTKPGAPPATIKGVKFRDYLNSDAYWKPLKAYIEKYEITVGPCPTAKLDGRAMEAVAPKTPVKLPKIGTPPQWLEVLIIAGCKKPYRRLVFSAISKKSNIVHIAMLGGGTRTGPTLQWDVLGRLLPLVRASAQKRGCAAIMPARVYGGRVIAEQKGANGMDWQELWTFSDCKGRRQFVLTFTRGEKGGTNWSAKERKKLIER